MEFVKRVHQGEIIPSGFGVAWAQWDRRIAVCLPVPLNIIAGLSRRAWLWLRWGWCGNYGSHRDAFAAGWLAAMQAKGE